MMRSIALAGITFSPMWGAKVEGPIIGIDLGTTYSCVGVYKNGRVDIIANDQGNRITPSYVAFVNDERLVGEAAKNQAATNPTQTVFDAKRLIGRRFNDASVQKDKKTLPYEILGKDGQAGISVMVKGQKKTFLPEEISALVLTKMKQIAENYLGYGVSNAVVTVPAYFNDAQRSATKNAGKIAGLNVERIINEPTAAALAYGLNEDSDKTLLVFDLGGGTFDVSLLSITSGIFEVMATNGDTHLGGEDFDGRIINFLAKQFQQKHGKDLTQNKAALAKLRHEVEKAKRSLSTSTFAQIDIESLHEGIDFSEGLSRAKFEQLNMDLFRKTMEPVKKVLEDASIAKKDISTVLLVGGSTRIPKVKELLSDFFKDVPISNSVNPDEAVAYGAAVQGGILGGESMGKELLLVDVIPLSLGLEDQHGKMDVYFPRNTAIPTKKTTEDTTVADWQTRIDFIIYEGERPKAADNHKLGEFSLTGIKKAKAGKANIETTMEIDANGILHVSAIDKDTGRSAKVVINNGGASEAQIEKMLRDAAENEEKDKEYLRRAAARETLTTYLASVKDAFHNIPEDIDEDDLRRARAAVASGDAFLMNQEATVEQIHEKHQKIEADCQGFLASANAGGGDGEEETTSDHNEL